MPYQRGASCRPEDRTGRVVFNASRRLASDPSLTPVSQEAADRVKAGMAPLLSGQAVPSIWERVTDDGSCDR